MLTILTSTTDGREGGGRAGRGADEDREKAVESDQR